MRKGLGLMVSGLLMIAIVAQQASGFPAGDYKGKLFDYGSFFAGSDRTSATPQPVVYKDAAGVVHNLPQVGWWDRTVVKISQLYTPVDATEPVYNGSPEMIGLIYDLKISAVTQQKYTSGAKSGQTYRVDVDLVAGGSFPGYPGGRIDFWADTPNNFDPRGDLVAPYGPSDWGAVASPVAPYNPWAAGKHDTFPTVTPPTDIAQPVFSGTFVAPAPATPILSLMLWVDKDPVLSYDAGQGISSTGYIHVLSNPGGWLWDWGKYLGGKAEIEFHNRFSFHPNTSITYEPVFDKPTTSTVWWDTASDDPVYFGLLPEPGSMALLGMGLIGLVGSLFARGRKKRQG